MPLTAEKIAQFNQCLSSVFSYTDAGAGAQQAAISANNVPALVQFIAENQPQPAELIARVDNVWAPPATLIKVQIYSEDSHAWGSVSYREPPADDKLAYMETVGRHMLTLSQQPDELGNSIKKLLDHFVEALDQAMPGTQVHNWSAMMSSKYKFFQTLRHIALKNCIRPFNDLLVKKSAFNKVNARRTTFIDVMLGVWCTKPIFFDGTAHSKKLINEYVDLILKTRSLMSSQSLQVQFIHQAQQMILQLKRRDFSFFGKQSLAITEQITALNQLILAIQGHNESSELNLPPDAVPLAPLWQVADIVRLFSDWKATHGLDVANTLQLEVIIDTYVRHTECADNNNKLNIVRTLF